MALVRQEWGLRGSGLAFNDAGHFSPWVPNSHSPDPKLGQLRMPEVMGAVAELLFLGF